MPAMTLLLPAGTATSIEGEPGQRGGDEQQRVVTSRGGAVADEAAEQAGDERAEQRKEDDRRDTSFTAQPFIRLTSSTAMVPRLRK